MPTLDALGLRSRKRRAEQQDHPGPAKLLGAARLSTAKDVVLVRNTGVALPSAPEARTLAGSLPASRASSGPAPSAIGSAPPLMTAHALNEMRLEKIKAEALRQQQLADAISGKAAPARPASRAARWVSSQERENPPSAAPVCSAAQVVRRMGCRQDTDPKCSLLNPAARTAADSEASVRESPPADPPAARPSHEIVAPRPLPARLRHLEDGFCALESTLLFFNSKRAEQPIFSLLRPQLERATGRAFTPEMLAAMLAVWPGAYEVRAAWPLRRAKGAAAAPERQEWLITWPPAETGPRTGRTDAHAARRAEMHERLVRHVATFHAEWLSEHAPESVPPAALAAWHPRFPVEDTPGPAPLTLPVLARRGGRLGTAHPTLPVPPGADGTVPALGSPKGAAPTVVPAPPDDARPAEPTAVDSPVPDPRLAGLSKELIAKVRAREAARAKAEAEGPSVRQSKLLQQLPEIALAVRAAMQRDRGADMSHSVLPVTLLLERLHYRLASASVSVDELRELLGLLQQRVPQWYATIETPKGTMARISNREFGAATRQLRDAAR